MKKRLLNGEMIELTNEVDSVTLWFQNKTNCFCLMLNGKLVTATKTWKPIETKLKSIGNLMERITNKAELKEYLKTTFPHYTQAGQEKLFIERFDFYAWGQFENYKILNEDYLDYIGNL